MHAGACQQALNSVHEVLNEPLIRSQKYRAEAIQSTYIDTCPLESGCSFVNSSITEASRTELRIITIEANNKLELAIKNVQEVTKKEIDNIASSINEVLHDVKNNAIRTVALIEAIMHTAIVATGNSNCKQSYIHKKKHEILGSTQESLFMVLTSIEIGRLRMTELLENGKAAVYDAISNGRFGMGEAIKDTYRAIDTTLDGVEKMIRENKAGNCSVGGTPARPDSILDFLR